MIFSIALTACCDYPGVDLIKGNPKEKQSDTEILTYFNKVHNSATQPSYSIRNCMKRSCDGRDKLRCHCFQRTTAWITSRKSFFCKHESWCICLPNIIKAFLLFATISLVNLTAMSFLSSAFFFFNCSSLSYFC